MVCHSHHSFDAVWLSPAAGWCCRVVPSVAWCLLSPSPSFGWCCFLPCGWRWLSPLSPCRRCCFGWVLLSSPSLVWCCFLLAPSGCLPPPSLSLPHSEERVSVCRGAVLRNARRPSFNNRLCDCCNRFHEQSLQTPKFQPSMIPIMPLHLVSHFSQLLCEKSQFSSSCFRHEFNWAFGTPSDCSTSVRAS